MARSSEHSPREPWIALLPASRLPALVGVRWWVLGVVILWLGLGAAATLLSLSTGAQGPPCLFRWLTTIPCPTCGTGRGAALLFSGDPLGALQHNPLVFALLAVVVTLLLLRLLTARRVTLGRGWPGGSTGLWIAGASLLLGNWAYLILTGK